MRKHRLTFTPFWRLTNHGWLPEYFGKVMRWGDGTYLNHTIIVPLVGEIVWWDRHPDPNRVTCMDHGMHSEEKA